MDPRIPIEQDIAMSVIQQEFEKLRTENERLRQRLADAENAQAELDRIRKAEIERLRVDLARAHWDIREQQRVLGSDKCR